MMDVMVKFRFFLFRGKIQPIVGVLMVAMVTVIFWNISTQSDHFQLQHFPSTDTILLTKHQLYEQRYKKFCSNRKNHSTENTRKEWDYKLFDRPKFLNNFKNPCFFANETGVGAKNETSQHVHCLPYFLVAGFPKAGTTDLWGRLRFHPDIKLKHNKELNFFHIGRFKGSFAKIARLYIKLFDRSSKELYRHVSPSDCQHEFPYFHGITGEATVDTAFDNQFWPMIPGNQFCREPVITNAHAVHHINPNMKVIFMIRNPVERLYSDYIYEARFLHYPTSPELFHKAVLETMQNHTECRKHSTLRACAYNGSIETYQVRLRVGMYSTFIKDWAEVFQKENILVVKSEDTEGPKIYETYARIFEFLGIRRFTEYEEKRIFKIRHFNARTAKERGVGVMLPETRAIIEDFYKEFNEDLMHMYPDIDYNKQSGMTHVND